MKMIKIKIVYTYFYCEIRACVLFTNNEKSDWSLIVPILKIELMCSWVSHDLRTDFVCFVRENICSRIYGEPNTVTIFIIMSFKAGKS